MRLTRIYVAQPLTPGASIQLEASTSHYVRNVLRLKAGATIALFNADDNHDYESLLSYQAKQAVASVQTRVLNTCESNLSSEIIQGLSRSDRMDWMLQKSTELGVSRISVFNSQHTQIPLKPAQLDKRLAHWRAIAVDACEQCGRHRPPEISFHGTLGDVLLHSIQREAKILLDMDGDKLISLLPPETGCKQISLLVGSEGGLSDTEIEAAKQAGFISIGLGPRVLRTETAAISALAIAQSLWERGPYP